jgi:transposase-like protein
MSREEHTMSERRTFTAAFKAKVVLEVLSERKSSAEVCRQYGIGAPLLSTWKATFLEHSAGAFQGEERCRQEQARIAELEGLVGRQALEIEVLKKACSSWGTPRRRNGSSA